MGRREVERLYGALTLIHTYRLIPLFFASRLLHQTVIAKSHWTVTNGSADAHSLAAARP